MRRATARPMLVSPPGSVYELGMDRSGGHGRKVAEGRRAIARSLVAGGLALLAVGPFGLELDRPADAKPPRAKVAHVSPRRCRPQRPQRFLERRSFVTARIMDPKKHAKALRYLAERYGNAGDPVTTAYNAESASAHAKTVRFMGLPISVHEKIAPALACVEKRIRATCVGRSRYVPKAIGGFRTANTYRGGEVSNHLLGIAVDVDPDDNPCCGCVDPWPTSPLCKDPDKTAYERAAMPRCWIHAFERYGFDWLGHDELEDTMHFEFLGDPDRISK